MTIKTLFDPARDIFRTIETVISYGTAQQERLKAEITEYVVTESIEDQLEKLLTAMQAAMEGGGASQVAVWVSGFYGSGKSSLTKYLGLALDQSVRLDGVPFLKHLQNRLKRPTTRALLGAVAGHFPAAVVLLDLASEMLAGHTMEDVSTVLYYKVLQWAGYSRNLKVAALERKLQQDGRYDEFTQTIEAELGTPWKSVQNDPLVVDSLIPDIAHRMYPALFRTPTAFSADVGSVIRFENDRVEEMINLVRAHSNRQHVLFVIDEVGQYVGSRPNLILNLDGLAKNIKQIGCGKAWLFCTAQQTLTEDDPRAALNSPDLFKLKDRFPIQIDLESRDIKEISHRRLLGKSPHGEKVLGDLFDKHGPALRQWTKLQDARYYDANFDRGTFVNLYPFLPAHFDVLLHLLGALAKSTGGIGLRSALKVIQDILIECGQGQPALAEQPVGTLVTTATLYEALEKDIRRAYPSLHAAVNKVAIRHPDAPLHQEVARTVAVLQILGNMPVTPQNVTGLTHPAIDSPDRTRDVAAAIEELLKDPLVPLGEKDGGLCFFSEKLNDIDQQRGQLTVKAVETRRIVNEALRDLFTPAPSVRLHNALTVTTGVKSQVGAQVYPLSGERETIQTVVQCADGDAYETVRTELLEDSRQKTSQHTVYLLGHGVPEIEEKAAEVYRAEEIVRRHRNDPDQEIKEYCNSQTDRAARLRQELQHLLRRCLQKGSFLFRGGQTAVEALAPDLHEAAKKHLTSAAAEVFDRFKEAPVQAETALAEKFLKVGNLRAVTAAIDPLSLVQMSGGVHGVRKDHKALVSVRDFLNRNGAVEGKRLLENFMAPPFGWSQDTVRYLVAAMLVAGEVKLKVAGLEVTVNGQKAIDGLRTNTSFKAVGVAPRIDQLGQDVLARAAGRLTELVGESVLPLEDEIAKAATKHFPRLQHRFAPLAERLDSLGLPGSERARSVGKALADLIQSDGSASPQRLGTEESELYADLKWAAEVDRGLDNVDETIRDLQTHRAAIKALPASGIPGRLQGELKEDLLLLEQRLAQEDCYKHAANLNSTLTDFQKRVSDAVDEMAAAQQESIKGAQEDLQRLPDWGELEQPDQGRLLGEVEAMRIDAPRDLDGLRRLLNQDYVLANLKADLRKRIETVGRQKRLERIQAERLEAEKQGRSKLTRNVKVPRVLASAHQLQKVIRGLQEIEQQFTLHGDIEVTVEIEG